jgi:hypothetical protein
MKAFLAVSFVVNVALLVLLLQSRQGDSSAPQAAPQARSAAAASPVDIDVDEQAIADQVATRLRGEFATRPSAVSQPEATPRDTAPIQREPEPAQRTPEQEDAADLGQRKLDQVVMKGHFVAEDTRELRRLAARMSPEDQLQMRRELTVAINSGKLDTPDPELIP